MASLIDFVTSESGIFAAVVAVVGLLAAIQGLVRPSLAARKASRIAKASLRTTQPMVSPLALSSRSCELRFEITNAGSGHAILTALRLVVVSHQPSTIPRDEVVEAPLTVYQHRVELRPDENTYDIRSRTYGPELPPLSFAEGETVAFVVKLVSEQPQRYSFCLLLEWYDTKAPSEVRSLRSETLTMEFPPTVREGRAL